MTDQPVSRAPFRRSLHLAARAAALGIVLATASAVIAGGHPLGEVRDSSLDTATHELRRVDHTLRRADVRDAKLQVFRHHPWARADVRSLALLDTAIEIARRDHDRLAALELAERFLRQAAEDGEAAFRLELARLESQERARLAVRLDCPPSVDDSACLLERFHRDRSHLLTAQLALLGDADGPHQLADHLGRLREDLGPSIKERGRLRRRILGAPAFLPVWVWRKSHSAHEYEGPQWIEFQQARLWRAAPGGPTETTMDPRHAELLARYAPVLVQEVDPDAPYPASVDAIGTFQLEARPERPQAPPRPAVDASHPASYAYIDTLTLHGRRLEQLVYTFWYPEHPKLKKGLDVEAGKVEGITLRVTLDAQDRPRLFETYYNCGCSHRLFVDRTLEEEAAAQYGPPEASRPYAIQRHLENRIDWIVPELVDVEPGGRIHLLMRAGFHMPAAVRFGLPETFPAPESVTAYQLRDYTELERLPWRGRPTGIFTDTGLVRGAGRLEGALLYPLGLYRAGQPRQRGTQLIHFDQADLDDPQLFDRYLRLPETFFAQRRWVGAPAATGEGPR